MPRAHRPAASLAVVALLSLPLLAPSAAAQWTSWRGPHQTGVSDERGLVASWSPAGEHLVWRADFVGRSTPVVFDGRVCAFGRQGTDHDRGERMTCWDAADGTKRWEVPFVVHNTTIPFTRAAWASPAADPETGYVYAQGSDGHLTCFDRDGAVVWQRALHEEQGRFSGYGGRTANPLVFEDLLIVNLIGTSFLGFERPLHRYYAFDKRTGEIVWTSAPSKDVAEANTCSNLVVATIGGREQLVGGAADGWIYGLEPRTGRKLWEFQLSRQGINATVVVGGDTVYASHSQDNVDVGTMGRLVAIDATGTGNLTKTGLRWQIDGLRAGHPSPALADGVLYVVDDSAMLHAIDAATGKQLWERKLGTVGRGAPVWADGKLYVTETNGRVWILKVGRDGSEVLDQEEIRMPEGRPAEIYGSIAVAGGRLYFATEEGLYCVGDPARPFTGPKGLAAPAPVPAGSGEPTHLQLVPAEVLLAPGERVAFRTRAFDALGRPLGPAQPVAALVADGLRAAIDASASSVTVAEDVPFQTGAVVAKQGALDARARVRVVAPPPWREDFGGHEPGTSLRHWIFGGRFKVADLGGERVLEKFPVRAGLQRTRTYLGPASWRDYTIEADVMSRSDGTRLADVGLVNGGYTLELLGAHQQVQVSSWHSVLRMARTVSFPWQADTWYRMRLQVEPTGVRQAKVRGKVWPRGEAEPAAWTIAVDDPFGVTEGAPGLYGYSPVAAYYDDLVVVPNAAATAPEAADPAPATAATAPPVPAQPAATPAPATPPRRAPRPQRRAPAPELPAAMFGGTPSRNMVSPATALPDDWDVESGRNVKWQAKLGSQSYGGPVVFGDTIYVGTNNESPRDPAHEGDRGVVMAFDATTGSFRWQLVHPKLPAGQVNDWPLQGVCSAPFVQGERLWYVSNEAQVVAADVAGFRDGENDGPFTGETDTDPTAGDVLWTYDMIRELDVFPHNMAASSPVAYDGILYVVTGNGVDEGHVNIPAPEAPSFVALDQETGALLWKSSAPGNRILHGSWSNPALGEAGGQRQVVFPGGDGWIYSFVPETGELLWKFDANPKDAVWELGGAGTRNNVISTPVFHDGKVYVGVGQDPEHGEGIGHLWAIDASKRGDVTQSGLVWHRGGEDFHRTISTVAIADGILYAADLSGFLYALDVATGKPYWTYDAFAAVWSSPFVADGKVYLTDEDGDVAILKHGKTMELIRELNMGSAIYTTPIARDGVLYIASRSHLWALAKQ